MYGKRSVKSFKVLFFYILYIKIVTKNTFWEVFALSKVIATVLKYILLSCSISI